jgi:hypothetical protein
MHVLSVDGLSRILTVDFCYVSSEQKNFAFADRQSIKPAALSNKITKPATEAQFRRFPGRSNPPTLGLLGRRGIGKHCAEGLLREAKFFNEIG